MALDIGLETGVADVGPASPLKYKNVIVAVYSKWKRENDMLILH